MKNQYKLGFFYLSRYFASSFKRDVDLENDHILVMLKC
jgi:hypothetical protein